MCILVASHISLGTINEIGPVTGKHLIITSQGSWIPEDDAFILLEKEYDIFCPAKRGYVKKRGLYEITPTIDQLKRR